MDSLENVTRARKLQTAALTAADDRAREHLRYAAFLDGLSRESGFEFDGFLTDQRILSAVIAALESECARALRAGLEILAREKERAVPCLLDPTGADLHPEIVRALRGIEQRHSLWLSARDFPQSEARHLVMKLKREPKGSPNAGLLDAGLTLFFFGQNQLFGEFPTRNVLGIAHPSGETLIEMSLRLMRAFRLKRKLFSLDDPPNAAHLEQLEGDAFRLFDLLRSLEYHPRPGTPKELKSLT